MNPTMLEKAKLKHLWTLFMWLYCEVVCWEKAFFKTLGTSRGFKVLQKVWTEVEEKEIWTFPLHLNREFIKLWTYLNPSEQSDFSCLINNNACFILSTELHLIRRSSNFSLLLSTFSPDYLMLPEYMMKTKISTSSSSQPCTLSSLHLNSEEEISL